MPQPMGGLLGGSPLVPYQGVGPAAQAWGAMQSGQPYQSFGGAAPSWFSGGMPAGMSSLMQLLQGMPGMMTGGGMPPQMAGLQQLGQGLSTTMSPQMAALRQAAQGMPTTMPYPGRTS